MSQVLKRYPRIRYLPANSLARCPGLVTGRGGGFCQHSARWEYTWPTLKELREAKKQFGWLAPDDYLQGMSWPARSGGKTIYCWSHLKYRAVPWGSMEAEDMFEHWLKTEGYLDEAGDLLDPEHWPAILPHREVDSDA